MVKKFFKIVLALFAALLIFSFWMSPRLGGIIPMGKERPDQQVEHLKFKDEFTKDYGLEYKDISQRPDLIKLRAEFQLDTLVKNCKTDFEKVKRIQSWVQSRWEHDGENTPKEKNALYILKEAEKGKKFRCVEYSLVAGQCLSALGFKIRSLGLMTKDIGEVKSGGGHATNEVYLEDLHKWVFIDPQFDVITVKGNVPLNAVELQKAIADNEQFEMINPNKTTTKEEYKNWIGPYLYYFYVGINGQHVSAWDRIVGNKKQLTLLSETAEKPVYFQRIFRINTSYYTNSIKDFYPILQKTAYKNATNN